MNSELKYFHMDVRDKINIPTLIMKGKSLLYISLIYELSERFLQKKFGDYFKYVDGIHFDTKKEPYYTNEDDYSKTPSYSWESLSFDEKLAYYTYEQKHKAHYD